MVETDAYMPDIMEGCVARVDGFFTAREDDPFNVFYDKGVLGQVKRSVYTNNQFPLIWFVMPYSENSDGGSSTTFSSSFQLIIAVPTDNTYTQQQRDDISFKPRLLPIMKQLLLEMQLEKWFSTTGAIKHTKEILPYWGMGDVNGPDQPNLFKEKFIDAISITIPSLKVKQKRCI